MRKLGPWEFKWSLQSHITSYWIWEYELRSHDPSSTSSHCVPSLWIIFGMFYMNHKTQPRSERGLLYSSTATQISHWRAAGECNQNWLNCFSPENWKIKQTDFALAEQTSWMFSLNPSASVSSCRGHLQENITFIAFEYISPCCVVFIVIVAFSQR